MYGNFLLCIQFIGSLRPPSCNFIAFEEKKPEEALKSQDNRTVITQNISNNNQNNFKSNNNILL